VALLLAATVPVGALLTAPGAHASVTAAASTPGQVAIDLNRAWEVMLTPGQRGRILGAPSPQVSDVQVHGPAKVRIKPSKNGRGWIIKAKKKAPSRACATPTTVVFVDPVTGRSGGGANFQVRVCAGESGIPD